MLYGLLAALLLSLAALAWALTRRPPTADTREGGEDQAQRVLDQVSLPVMMIDKDFNILSLNAAGAALGGKPASAYLGSKCYDLFRTGHCRTEHCALAQAMASGQVASGRTTAQPAPGVALPILYSGSPVRDAQGRIIGAIEHVLDFTQITGVQQEVQGGCRQLDQATAELKDMVRRVNKEFHSVTTDILSCAEGTEQMRGNFESATGATTQVLEIFDGLAHSVEGMVTTVDEIAHSTEEANVRTQRAVDHARGMEGRVSALTQASGEIGSIVNTISVISDQTKLLALNATIEAARAGEAGKGFAVVADEVKALATQTGQAIQDIQLKVSGILETSRGTAQDIATVAHLISEVGDSIHRVTASMEAQNHATRDISAHIGSAVNRLKAASGSVDGAAGAAMEISCHVQDVRSSIKAVEARIRGAGVQTVHLRELSERLQAASRQLDN